MITRTAPNGATVNFPDGTSEEKIQAWLSQPKYEASVIETDTKRNFLTDIPLQAVGGVFDAVSNTWGFIEGLGDTLGEKTNIGGLVFGDEADNGFIGYKSHKELVEGGHSNILFGKYGVKDALRLPEIDEPDTIAGGFTRGIAQFVGGFIGGGKLLKGAGTFLPTKSAIAVTKGIAKAPIVPSLTKGVVADTLVFDEEQGRLTDVIINYAPSMKNTYLSYLASDADDTFWEGRLKNATEGLFLGGITESLFRTLRYTKNKRKQINKETYNKKQLKEDENYIKDFDETKPPKVGSLKVKASKFDDVKVDEIIDENFAKWKAGEIDFDQTLDLGFNINSWKKLDKEGIGTIQALTRALEKNLKKLSTPQQYQILERRAERMYGAGNDINVKKVLKDGAELAGNLEKAPVTVIAHEVVTMSMLNLFPKMVRAYKSGLGEVSLKDVKQAQFLLENAFLNTRRIRTAGGRLLNIFQYTKDKAMGFSDLKARIEGLTTDYKIYGGDYEKFLDQVVASSGDPHVLAKVLGSVTKNKTWNVANEVWINALLSNPKTHLINMSSNVINTFLRPLETMVGSRLNLWMENPAKVAQLRQAGIDATYVYAGLYRYLDDVVKYTRVAFKNEDTVLSGGGRTKIDTPVKTIKGTLGKVIRYPTRFLNAEDEFFKQINGRARLFSIAVRDALANNKSRTKIVGTNIQTGKPITEFDAHVENYFRKGFDETNTIMIDPEALRYAEEATFTQNLHGISKNIQDLANKYPFIKQVIPFVRTPINLFKATLDRLPVAGLARKEFRDQFTGKAGGYKMAEARGKQAIGTAIMLYTSLVLRDRLEGASPRSQTPIKSPDLKNLAKTTTGWQPYSIRVGNKTYAFGRLDPFGALLGIVADYNLVYDKLTKEELESIGDDFNQLLWSQGENPLPASSKLRNMASSSWTSLTRNALSKTYLMSLTEFLEAITDDDTNKMDRFIQNKIGSYIPNLYTKLINDPYFRDAKTILDNAKKRTGADVQVKYNFRGEALKYSGDFTDRLMDTLVNPLSPKEIQEDKVAEEILRIGQNIAPVKQFLEGVDLTQFVLPNGKNAFDEYQELISKSGLNDYLLKLISTEGYKNLSDPVKIDAQQYDKGGKYKYIKKAVDMHRSKALNQLMSKLSNFKSIHDDKMDLRTAYVRAKRNKAYISAGVEIDKSKLEGLYRFSQE